MRVLDWNGRDLPDALKALPPGRYVLQPVDELLEIDAEEERGLQDGIAELDRDEGLAHTAVLEIARRLARR